MKFKEIQDKASYLKKNYPFVGVPKLTDKKYCIHCCRDVIVGNYKVEIANSQEYIVCPNAPTCKGTVVDWFDTKKK
jgi:hypothetical protein